MQGGGVQGGGGEDGVRQPSVPAAVHPAICMLTLGGQDRPARCPRPHPTPRASLGVLLARGRAPPSPTLPGLSHTLHTLSAPLAHCRGTPRPRPSPTRTPAPAPLAVLQAKVKQEAEALVGAVRAVRAVRRTRACMGAACMACSAVRPGQPRAPCMAGCGMLSAVQHGPCGRVAWLRLIYPGPGSLVLLVAPPNPHPRLAQRDLAPLQDAPNAHSTHATHACVHGRRALPHRQDN